MKVCPRCRVELDKSEFYYSKKSSDGLDSWCKSCRRAYQKRYKAYKRRYSREYGRTHLEQRVRYVERNIEHIRERRRENYRKNPTRYARNVRIRRLRLKGIRVEGFHTEEEWQELLHAHDHKCAGCGATGVEITKDHITPISVGGSDDIWNIAPLCRSCNSKKAAQGADWYKQLL